MRQQCAFSRSQNELDQTGTKVVQTLPEGSSEIVLSRLKGDGK